MYQAVRFQPSSPAAKANGQVLMPYYGVLQGSKLEHLIATYSLDKLEPQTFYPQQAVCDMQRQMSAEMGLFSGELVSIGIKSIDTIGFPPEAKTVSDALNMLHQIYQMIHQNIPAEEGWAFEQIDENVMRIHFNSPYEQFAAYGYIYGIARRFAPGDKDFSVTMEEESGLSVYRVEYQ